MMNRRIFCYFALAAILITNISCNMSSPSIIGKWVAISHGEEKVTFVFKSDNTILWTADSDSVSAKYSVDYTTKPMQVDIFDFSADSVLKNSELRNRVLFGIFELKGKDTMLFELPHPFSSAGRPKFFGDRSLVFKKQ